MPKLLLSRNYFMRLGCGIRGLGLLWDRKRREGEELGEGVDDEGGAD